MNGKVCYGGSLCRNLVIFITILNELSDFEIRFALNVLLLVQIGVSLNWHLLNCDLFSRKCLFVYMAPRKSPRKSPQKGNKAVDGDNSDDNSEIFSRGSPAKKRCVSEKNSSPAKKVVSTKGAKKGSNSESPRVKKSSKKIID